ncbi:MAG: hypothetical protein EA365_00285 [Gloeocapsa sp. DLM2.Bin57]|nr:MAG: hypothetical protein EA365_00285 [Gloeocapsa sp. DLM2.Bin57]
MEIKTESPKISYKSQQYYLEKKYDLGNSNRILHPKETLAKIKPYFPKIVLTRLGNITGLDRVGVPVTIAIRPNSYSLTQSSGKSTNLEAALVSAAMESIELYCAENIQPEIIGASYNQVQKSFNVIALEDIEFSQHHLFNSDRPEDWVIGWDIVNQEEVAVPHHSVSLDFRILNQLKCPYSFTMSSNGLASGNHFLEAVISGLYEVIERDGVSCHTEANCYGKKKIQIDLSTVDDTEIQKLCQQLASKQLLPIVCDCTNDIGVPVFEAYVYDLESNTVSISHGYGAHLNPHIAILRALTEAIQSRTIIISGSRDDIFRDIYQANRFRYQSSVNTITNNNELVKMNYRNQTSHTFNEDIFLLIDQLKKAGLNSVIVVDLSPTEIDIAVVKVIVPGLEGYHYYGYRPRRRAKKFVVENCPPNLPIPNSYFQEQQEVSHRPAGGIL